MVSTAINFQLKIFLFIQFLLVFHFNCFIFSFFQFFFCLNLMLYRIFLFVLGKYWKRKLIEILYGYLYFNKLTFSIFISKLLLYFLYRNFPIAHGKWWLYSLLHGKLIRIQNWKLGIYGFFSFLYFSNFIEKFSLKNTYAFPLKRSVNFRNEGNLAQLVEINKLT